MTVGVHRALRRTCTLGAVALGCGMLSAWALPDISAAAQSPGGWSSPKVLLAGTFDGKAGQYRTIQSAVNAARPGDWILVGPGDTTRTRTRQARAATPLTGRWAACTSASPASPCAG
jgi:hypothetical protein